MADPQAPLTEAGRALLDDAVPLTPHEEACAACRDIAAVERAEYAVKVAAVEQQAAANERARLAALVEWIGGNDACFCDADRSLCIDEVYVSRESVLRLLREGAAG